MRNLILLTLLTATADAGMDPPEAGQPAELFDVQDCHCVLQELRSRPRKTSNG